MDDALQMVGGRTHGMYPCSSLGIFMGICCQQGSVGSNYKLPWVIWVNRHPHLVRNQAFKDIKLRSDKTVRVQRPGIRNMVSFAEIAGHSCRFL